MKSPEFRCARDGCKNKARWELKRRYYCGRHCNSKVKDRKAIQVLVDAQKARSKENAKRRRKHLANIESRLARNKCKGRVGKVRSAQQPHYRSKAVMDKRHPLRKGYLNISVCSGSKKWKGLSPMYLGPVDAIEMDNEGEPLPKAKNIENYWQFAKVYKSEVENPDEKDIYDVAIKEKYWKTRRKGYMDDKPHRRKIQGSANAPLFSVFGNRRYKYKDARIFYCHQYETLVKKTKEYKELVRMIRDGYCVQIIGYDGVDVAKVYDNDWEAHYADTSRPFGHESVLTLMLIGEFCEVRFPWSSEVT